MSGFTESWALGNKDLKTPAEKLALWRIASTVGTDNYMAEIRLDDLIEFTLVSEGELRETLNALTSHGIIRNTRPAEEEKGKSDPRIFDCELTTPQEWRWDF